VARVSRDVDADGAKARRADHHQQRFGSLTSGVNVREALLDQRKSGKARVVHASLDPPVR
jgi:hypothetical protein